MKWSLFNIRILRLTLFFSWMFVGISAQKPNSLNYKQVMEPDSIEKNSLQTDNNIKYFPSDAFRDTTSQLTVEIQDKKIRIQDSIFSLCLLIYNEPVIYRDTITDYSLRLTVIPPFDPLEVYRIDKFCDSIIFTCKYWRRTSQLTRRSKYMEKIIKLESDDWIKFISIIEMMKFGEMVPMRQSTGVADDTIFLLEGKFQFDYKVLVRDLGTFNDIYDMYLFLKNLVKGK